KALQARLSEAERLLSDAETEAEELQREKNGLSEMRREKEQLFQSLTTSIETTEASLTSHRVDLQVLENLLTDHESKSGTTEDEIRKSEERMKSMEEEIASAQDAVDLYRKKISDAEKEQDEFEKRLKEGEEKIRAIRKACGEIEASAGATDSRIRALRAIEEQFEGYSHSVRFVMEEAAAGRLSGICGPLSRLIEVPTEYATAIEAALGNALQNIVVEDEDSAKAAIASLKKASAGRATFYPISCMRASDRGSELKSASARPGFVGFADELVKTDGRYREIVRYLLGRIAVFKTLDEATPFARQSSWKVRCVTLDGQQIHVGGSFTGGSAAQKQGILSRSAQIALLEEEKKKAQQSLTEKKKETEKLERESAEILSSRDVMLRETEIVRTLLRTETTRLEGLQAQQDILQQHLIQLKTDISALSDEAARGGTDKKRLKALCEKEEVSLEEARTRREAVGEERKALDEQNEDWNLRMQNTQILLAERRKDAENLRASFESGKEEILRLKEEIGDSEAEQARLHEEKKEAEKEIESSGSLGDETKKLLDEKESVRKNLEEEGMDLEKRQNEVRLQLREISGKKEIIIASNTKNINRRETLQTEIEKMAARLWDEYELTHSSALALGVPEVSYGERVAKGQRLTELRNQLRGLGNVNVGAIDEFREVRERYEGMKVQLDDLNLAREDVLRLIGEVEARMKELFTGAFEQINRNFNEVFRELFGGGHAQLTLTDPSDVLNCGIEIAVAPPGKIIKSLTLLSGGEQAFVAIALLFAIIKVNPSPFCIFDEIEAALDEVNITRVARYIHRYSEKMQIVMITHRRGTMDVADTLYGVTMPRLGVSKVFTLDVKKLSGEEISMLTDDKKKA
ncbi:MAG: chromosome segregation protein SMC, partial [Clostridia bacterium]|nr:chromosome segregation protein SMC [Clostridia bacterium]